MDSLKDWASVLEWLKRPSFAFAATIILCTLLLSSEILNWLGLGGFRWIVAILFLLALSVLLSQVIAATWASLRQWKRNSSVVANRRKRLQQLTHDEKLVLKRYIDGQTRTQYLDINDGIVAGLEQAEIINRASVTSVGMFTFPYNLTDFAWDYLNKHPGILAGL
jgi:Super-infection exclusion protein B